MIKLAIDFHEDTQDYATCYWYGGLSNMPFKSQDYATCYWYKGLDNKPFYKVEISKSYNCTDYNNEWKQGLYTFMHNQIMEKFGSVMVVDI